MQEIAVSPKALVVCGSYSIEWEKIDLLNKMTVLRLPHLERLVAIRELYQNEVAQVPEEQKIQWWAIDQLDLARLVTINRNCGACDSRDRIYALWAMVDQMTGQDGTFGLKPNYSIPEDELFRSFTNTYMRSTKRLDLILAKTSAPSLIKNDWPSWVWQGSYSFKVDPAYYGIFAWPQPGSDTSWHFDATLDSLNDHYEVSKCGGYLRCAGIIIARVEQVGLPRPDSTINYLDEVGIQGPIFDVLHEFLGEIQCFVSWYHIAVDNSNDGIYRQTGEACRDVLWQLCCAYVPYSDYFETMGYYNAFEDVLDPFLRLPVRLRRSNFVFFLLLLWQLCNLLITTLFEASTSKLFRVHEFVKTSGLSCNRALFQASTGKYKLLGLGQINVIEGDTIVLLQGARVPVVLRKRQSCEITESSEPQPDETSFENSSITSDTYTLIGECLIHGIMYGEKYDSGKCHDIWLR